MCIRDRYESRQSEDDESYMPEDSDMESNDGNFSATLEDDMGAKTVVGWTFVRDPSSDHCDTSLKEYRKQFDIHRRSGFLSIFKLLHFSSPKYFIKKKPLTRIAQY